MLPGCPAACFPHCLRMLPRPALVVLVCHVRSSSSLLLPCLLLPPAVFFQAARLRAPQNPFESLATNSLLVRPNRVLARLLFSSLHSTAAACQLRLCPACNFSSVSHALHHPHAGSACGCGPSCPSQQVRWPDLIPCGHKCCKVKTCGVAWCNDLWRCRTKASVQTAPGQRRVLQGASLKLHHGCVPSPTPQFHWAHMYGHKHGWGACLKLHSWNWLSRAITERPCVCRVVSFHLGIPRFEVFCRRPASFSF